jgi:hypothetical protein
MTVEKGDRYTYYAIIMDGHLLEIEPDALARRRTMLQSYFLTRSRP